MPEEYETLSADGKTGVQKDSDKIKFFFYTFKGFSDSFSGYIYVSNESSFENGHFGIDLFSEYTTLISLGKGWYWIGTT